MDLPWLLGEVLCEDLASSHSSSEEGCEDRDQRRHVAGARYGGICGGEEYEVCPFNTRADDPPQMPIALGKLKY